MYIYRTSTFPIIINVHLPLITVNLISHRNSCMGTVLSFILQHDTPDLTTQVPTLVPVTTRASVEGADDALKLRHVASLGIEKMQQ